MGKLTSDSRFRKGNRSLTWQEWGVRLHSLQAKYGFRIDCLSIEGLARISGVTPVMPISAQLERSGRMPQVHSHWPSPIPDRLQ